MIPKDVRELLERHLVDINKLNYMIVDEEYWLVFSGRELTGFEISGNPQGVYHIKVWSTTEFFRELYINKAWGIA